MKSADVRQKFLMFFKEKGHDIQPSASLVPVDDPSLLWINSGVATLKKYFDGRLVPKNPRITNVQKSIRTNDIENVGYTSRHHTFFEMLGNFSIGDYFKEEAIAWAWEFLTDSKWLGLDPEKLSVTIHPEDEESYVLWHEKIGVPKERIVRLEGNFWDIGEGPCGPNSEIFYDRGEAYGDTSDPECYPGGENERFLEIWNLVFSQYNHHSDGSFTPLPKKNIDTGMGLERMVSVLQGVSTNYDTDLFQPVIQKIAERTGVRYGQSEKTDIAFRVIADHIRTTVFTLADGVLPSNEGRGYVIRRLIRRAVRYGRRLNIHEPFMYTLVDTVVEGMQDFYSELSDKQSMIRRVIQEEEERFFVTLRLGLKMLQEMIQAAKKNHQTVISGEDAFKLYDTYGFPIELAHEFVAEHGLTIDQEDFERQMADQQERARAAREQINSMQTQGQALSELEVESEFVGYVSSSATATVTALLKKDQVVSSLESGEAGLVILDQTPFYAESGGQVADRGWLIADKVHVEVQDVQKGPNGEHIHSVLVKEGVLRHQDTVHAEVDSSLRDSTAKNHTATHLLHKALREVLGEHVRQAGSLVSPDRLRFDFFHTGVPTEEELAQVEKKVNEQIWRNTEVKTTECTLQEAQEKGATALFGEKYGERVRMVEVGDYSLELCGGTHVRDTAMIGCFKIIGESGIGSGIRRIEALTEKAAFEYLTEQVSWFHQIARSLKSPLSETVERVQGLRESIKELTREKEQLQSRIGRYVVEQLKGRVQEVEGIAVLVEQVEGMDMKGLRETLDILRNSIEKGVILLSSVVDDKILFLSFVSPDCVQMGLHAGHLVKEVAEACGGSGGGRPDMAQAGGKDPTRLPKALQKVVPWVLEQVYNEGSR